MTNEEYKYKKDLVNIIKKYNLDSNHPPKYWPEISDSTKANVSNNVDKNISHDSIIAIFDTTLFGNSCKNGIVFTVLGLYNIESFSSPQYANYSNIKNIEPLENKININLKNGKIITNYNGAIKNRSALCDLLKELVQYNSKINDSLKNEVHIILPNGTEEWFDANGKTHDKTRRVSHWYDSRGNVIRAARPDGTDYYYHKDSEGTEHWYDEKRDEIHRKNTNGKEYWYSKKSNHPIRTKEPDGVENWFDEQGINTYRKKPDGTEHWFDENGKKEVRRKSPNGTEYLFNEQGNNFYTKKADGTEIWFDYDDNKKLIHQRDSIGNECWYNENEKISHQKDADGTERWFNYDENGKVIHASDSTGNEYWYDENEKISHQKDADNTERWFGKNGDEIHRKKPDGTELWYDFGRIIHRKKPDGTEIWYDSNGNIIRKKDSNGAEWEAANATISKNTSGGKTSSGKYDEQEAQDMAARYGRNATDADIENVQNNMGKMNKGPLAKIWDKVMTLWAGFNSPNTPASLKAMIIGGLIYMVSPIDLIPDFIPILGLTDDVGVISFVFSQFVRLTAGAAIVAVAAIKLHRLGVEEIRKAIKERETHTNSFIVEHLEEGEEKWEAHVGLLDENDKKIGEETFEAKEKAPEIREGIKYHV